MMQVVQASCPRCRKTLRIPADWIAQPLRCKHCKQIFQGKPRANDQFIAAPPLPPSAAPMPTPMPVPTDQYVASPPPVETLDQPLIARSSPTPAKRPKGKSWAKPVLFTAVFGL